jgi:sigma-B regulation protein RsbU (phosphoserine phosphatase)
VLNLATGHLDYCNAGHDAPVLIGYQGLGLLPCEANLPIGVMPGWKFKSQKTLIDPHTTIFLYTDGLTEAENIDHDLFGEHRMLNELAPLREADTYKPEQVISHITLAIHDFVGEAEQSDDLTMLAIQYCVDS